MEKDKIVVTLEVSDKKRKNTTLKKILKSLDSYKDYDVVKFKILDLYNSFDKEKSKYILTRMINILKKGKKIEVIIDDERKRGKINTRKEKEIKIILEEFMEE